MTITTTRLETAYRAHANELIRDATALVGPDPAVDVSRFVTDASVDAFDG